MGAKNGPDRGGKERGGLRSGCLFRTGKRKETPRGRGLRSLGKEKNLLGMTFRQNKEGSRMTRPGRRSWELSRGGGGRTLTSKKPRNKPERKVAK